MSDDLAGHWKGTEMICADNHTIMQCVESASAGAVAGVGNADSTNSARQHAVVHEAIGDLVVSSKF